VALYVPTLTERCTLDFLYLSFSVPIKVKRPTIEHERTQKRVFCVHAMPRIACKCRAVFALLLIVRADSFAFLDVHTRTHTQIAAFGFSPKHSRRNAFVNYQLVYERAPFLVYNYAKQFEHNLCVRKNANHFIN
jgi:hypothetical protein